MLAVNHHSKVIRVTLEMMPKIGYDLPLELFDFPHASVGLQDCALSLHQEVGFYNRLLDVFPDPMLGIKLAAIYPVSIYGALGFAILSAENLRTAFEVIVAYRNLTFTLLNIGIKDSGGVTTLQLSMGNINLNDKLMAFFADRDTSSAFMIINAVLGERIPFERVTLVHDGHGQKDEYRKYFACDVQFKAPYNSLSIDNDYLDYPAPYRDREAYFSCLAECQMQLSKMEQHEDLVGQVYQQFLRLPGYLHNIDTIASQLNVTERTLQRRLGEQGTSCQRLRQDARFQMAREYLLNTELRLKEVAELLGYSEAASFSHAFKRWSNGVSPRAFRKQAMAP